MTTGNKAILAIAVAIIVIVGAVGVYVATMPSKTGKVSIMVKDLPGDWTHMNVTFSEVKIHQADGANASGWHNLTIATSTIDLAVLVNVSELLASANVGPGNYTQIRLVVDAVTGTMANGTVITFKVPSGELKTTHPFNVTAGQTTTLTLDFDLDHSIVHNANGYTFKPVLGAITVS